MTLRKGDTKLGIWFYDASEAGKPEKDGFAHVAGKTVAVIGARYAVWKWRWDGTSWRRLRRETGPLPKSEVLARLAQLKSRRVATICKALIRE